MNDLSQHAWFYTRGGVKAGPVDYAGLQSLAKEGGLNPRQDMIWSKGMDNWKLAGEVKGLFERRVVEEIAAPAPPSAAPGHSHTPPIRESHEVAALGQTGWPGARRRSYLFMVIVFPLLWGGVIALGGSLMQQKPGGDAMSLIATGAALVPALVVIYFGLSRLVNLGMSRWWFLGNIVPFLNFWVGYRCFACPAGYAVHKKMDGVGIFLAIIYWLLIALVILSVAALIAVIFGAIDNPELKQQILDALKLANQAPAAP